MKIDDFKKGQRVRVVRAVVSNDQDLMGRELTVDRIERSHGYVVAGCCTSDGPRCAGPTHGKWWIYPDALEIVA